MMTIADEKRIWEVTNGNPFGDDYLKLLDKIFESSSIVGYPLEFHSVDESETTFHPLKAPLTVQEVRERYRQEGNRAISPAFIDLVKKVRDYNLFCRQKEKSSYQIDRVEISDYMNFIYLAGEILNKTPSHERDVQEGWFRKRWVQKEDKSPIVILTNPKEDGLTEVLEPALVDAGKKKNRAIRVISLGSNSEKLVEHYLGLGVKDIRAVDTYLAEGIKEEFGVFTNERSIFGKFSGQSDLLGIENKISAMLKERNNWEYHQWLVSFRNISVC